MKKARDPSYINKQVFSITLAVEFVIGWHREAAFVGPSPACMDIGNFIPQAISRIIIRDMRDERASIDSFWLTISLIMAQAERLLDLPGALSEGMRLTIGRLIRMAGFMVKRLIALQALNRFAAGDRAEPVFTNPPPNRPHLKPVRDNGLLTSRPLPLVEAAFFLSFSSQTPSHPIAGPDQHDPLQAIDITRLRNKLAALTRAINDKEGRVQRLLRWLEARGEEETCIPWRFGHTPYQRHREHGEQVRRLTRQSDTALDEHIALRHREWDRGEPAFG